MERVWVDGRERLLTSWTVTFVARGGSVDTMVADSSGLTWNGAHNDDVAVVVGFEELWVDVEFAVFDDAVFAVAEAVDSTVEAMLASQRG